MESTCTGAADYGAIIYYSHLIPLSITLLLAFFVLIKSKFTLLSKIFFGFSIVFCLWLLGDIVTWVSQDFSLISAAWSPLDFLNICFYLLALYFFLVFIKGKDIKLWQKITLFVLSLPPWILTITNNSIIGFDAANCEAVNNEFLSQYKLALELLVVVVILITTIRSYFADKKDKFKKTIFVASALILFFVVFSITEFIASSTGYYELNLYSLFILPIFLFMIIYAIINLQALVSGFNGTQFLTYVMIILVGSQFFFLENTTNQILTAITFILSLSFGVLLTNDAKKELEQRKKIEKLAGELQSANTRLLELDKQKSEFVSFATHQLKSPLAAMKGYASLLLDGDYGEISEKMKEPVGRIYESTKTLAVVVEDYLNISRIELGTMKYNFTKQDLKKIIENVIAEIKPNIDKTGLDFSFEANESIELDVDSEKIQQVFMNIIDNSIKYTPSGFVKVKLEKKDKKAYFTVSDSGIGMSKETIPKLFEKFSRAYNANKTNIHGTGLGLFVAKEIVKAHGGEIKAESEGEGKGSKFIVILKGK